MGDHQLLDDAIGLTDADWERRMAEASWTPPPPPPPCRACKGRALGPDALPCVPCGGLGVAL